MSQNRFPKKYLSRNENITSNYRFQFSENTSLCLDLLRVIASQLVVIGHGASFMGIFLLLHEPPVGNFPWIQNIGVVIFFLLSGLLITWVTFNKMTKGSYNFKIFFIERFSRIFSGYIPALFTIAIIDAVYLYFLGGTIQYNSYNASTFIGNVFMLQDFPLLKVLPKLLDFIPQIALTSFGTARQLWTLGVEWWIYMFFGWLFLGLTIIKNRYVYLFLLFLFALCPIYYCWPGSRGGGLMIVWIMGCIISVILNFKVKKSLGRWSLLPAITLLLLATLRVYLVKNAYDLPFAFLFMVGVYFLILYTNYSKFILPKSVKKVIHITADYSLTLYLLHYSIFVFLTAFLDSYSPYILFVIGVILSNALSFTIAYFTEMRYKKLRAFLIMKLKLGISGK